MTQKPMRGRGAANPPPVPIRPLVLLDFGIGSLLLIGGLLSLRSAAPAGPGGAGPAQFIGGGILLAFGLGMFTVGGLLFTRQVWSYWIALVVHALLFSLQAFTTVMMVVIVLRMSIPLSAMSMPFGCYGFMLLLYGLCTHHAWKLIKADKKRAEAIRLAREEPEMDVAPGWDEGPKQP